MHTPLHSAFPALGVQVGGTETKGEARAKKDPGLLGLSTKVKGVGALANTVSGFPL